MTANPKVWTDEFGRRCSHYNPGTYEGPFWCVGSTKRGSVCAADESVARAVFKEITGEDALKCGRLPYGASPSLNIIVYSETSTSAQGNFCFDPDNCMGYSSCPKRRACSE